MIDAPKKTDDPAVIQVTAGPYAGQRLTMSKAEAEAAIAEKWAVDPKEAPKEMTDEERAEIKTKAEKAARKLRGEPEAESVTRDMTPEHPAPYQTRAAPKK